jgi:hypothetical protein
MANWKAIITGKESVDSNGEMKVSYSIVRDEETVLENVSDSGSPDQIQQIIEARVQAFAPQWELAQELQVGQELEIIPK